MRGPSKKRLQEGALSALKTPENLPAQPRLVPVEASTAEGAEQAGEPLRRKPARTSGQKADASREGADLKLVQEAVSSAKAGDQGGIDFLYVQYGLDVQRFIGSFVKDERLSEEITQDIFGGLIAKIGKYDPREVSFVAWIMRLARNAALDHMRAQRAVPAEEVRIADWDVEKTGTGVDRGRELRHALEQLPESQREVLILRHIAGLTPVEIATTLQVSESSVHALHHRGRRTLQAQLAELTEHQHALQELVEE